MAKKFKLKDSVLTTAGVGVHHTVLGVEKGERGKKKSSAISKRKYSFLKEDMSEEDLLEELAALEHDQWMEWSKAVAEEVSEDRKDRWKSFWVSYEELAEDVKDADRKYAEKVLEILKPYLK